MLTRAGRQVAAATESAKLAGGSFWKTGLTILFSALRSRIWFKHHPFSIITYDGIPRSALAREQKCHGPA